MEKETIKYKQAPMVYFWLPLISTIDAWEEEEEE